MPSDQLSPRSTDGRGWGVADLVLIGGLGVRVELLRHQRHQLELHPSNRCDQHDRANAAVLYLAHVHL